MTREEQIDWLCRLRADLNNGIIFTPWNKEFTEALTGILEQEPCTDAISRQAALALTDELKDDLPDDDRLSDMVMSHNEGVLEYQTKLSLLPPVTPAEKVGRWIMPVQDDGMSDPIYYQVRCSECGFDLDPQTWHQELYQFGADKFCPNCGAKMVDLHKSEG